MRKLDPMAADNRVAYYWMNEECEKNLLDYPEWGDDPNDSKPLSQIGSNEEQFVACNRFTYFFQHILLKDWSAMRAGGDRSVHMFFEELGIPVEATQTDIEHLYKRFLRENHHDLATSPEDAAKRTAAMSKFMDGWKILLEPLYRERYVATKMGRRVLEFHKYELSVGEHAEVVKVADRTHDKATALALPRDVETPDAILKIYQAIRAHETRKPEPLPHPVVDKVVPPKLPRPPQTPPPIREERVSPPPARFEPIIKTAPEKDTQEEDTSDEETEGSSSVFEWIKSNRAAVATAVTTLLIVGGIAKSKFTDEDIPKTNNTKTENAAKTQNKNNPPLSDNESTYKEPSVYTTSKTESKTQNTGNEQETKPADAQKTELVQGNKQEFVDTTKAENKSDETKSNVESNKTGGQEITVSYSTDQKYYTTGWHESSLKGCPTEWLPRWTDEGAIALLVVVCKENTVKKFCDFSQDNNTKPKYKLSSPKNKIALKKPYDLTVDSDTLICTSGKTGTHELFIRENKSLE